MTIKLQDICIYVKGKISVKNLTNENYISTENMLPNKAGVTTASTLPATLKTQIYQKNDVLISNIRPYFKKIWYANKDGGCSNDVLVLRAKEGINPKFLYYALSSDDFFKYSMSTSNGTKMPRGDKTLIMSYVVPNYDVATQQRIASVLSVLDDKIELNNRINKNLEEQAQAVFKSWFVDFEPFGGVMPNDWYIDKLGNFVKVKRGGSPRPIQEFLSDTGYNWLKISDVTRLESPYVLKTKEHIKETGLNKTVMLKQGSLVLSNSATPGIPKILDIDSCIHDGWLYFPESLLSNEYLYLLFKAIRNSLIMLGNGSIFIHLKTDILKNFNIIMPDISTLNNFQSLIIPFFKTMKNISRENQRLSALRDALLPELLNGRIDVSEVKI
ncbi:MAG: restriction endonuclease subunit S [Ruminococcus sp.]|nr:restriction endonuclease subunit S [Ruminococcus sp.]